MRCGPCNENFKSWVRLQAHNAKVHGAKNNMSKFTESRADRQERINKSEEALQREISKARGHSY